MVRAAVVLSDLTFDDAEIDSMLDGLNGYRSSYQAIRRKSLTNDVSPAFVFSPVPQEYIPEVYNGLPDEGLPAKVQMPENREELCFYSVSELSVLLRTRQVNSEELTRLYISRLKKYDPVLHCVVTLLEDRAMAQAKQADREIIAGKYRGPLHGIPYGVKDLLDVEGVPSTWGSKLYEKHIAGHTAAVVQRLDSAGAVL
ncbi:MAG: amidase, partial [Bacteroidales bacterium]|nr:amidase [Bacteroidales bacterium]